MKPLLAAFGVDYGQWKALTIAALKLDFRLNTWSARHGSSTAHGIRVIIVQLAFYGLTGIAMAFAVAIINDRFVAGLIVSSYVIFMVGTAMLVEHNATVISPTDYAILGFFPVTSRTYFAARLTNVLVYTLGATTALGGLPAAAFFVRHGFAVGMAATTAVYASSISVTLAVVAGYLWLVRRLGVRRLQSLVSYLQLATGFIIYGGFVVVSEFVSTNALAGLHFSRTPWLLFYPGAWFASYIDLAAGQTGLDVILPVLASIATLVFLASKLRGRLSLEYAQQIAALTTAGTTVDRRARASTAGPGRLFRQGEARAVALLVRSHFRNDLKFRMGVLSILPITLLYLFMGVRGSDGGEGSNDPGRLSMVTMAVILFPTMLKLNIARSDAFRASWIFFATPADRTRLVRASTNVLVAFFVLPYLAFVGLTLAWFTDNPAYLAVYLILAGLLSHLALITVTCMDPELPFAKPITKGSAGSRLFGAFLVLGIFGALVPVLSNLIYRSTIGLAVTLTCILAVSYFLHRLTRARVERRARQMEFLG